MMMQRSANENAACKRRICKRSDQPKIDRVANNDTKLILISALHYCLQKCPSVGVVKGMVNRKNDFFSASSTALRQRAEKAAEFKLPRHPDVVNVTDTNHGHVAFPTGFSSSKYVVYATVCVYKNCMRKSPIVKKDYVNTRDYW